MAKLLFSLRNVPDDEASEVRALLDQYGFGWSETDAGILGLAAPGLGRGDAGESPRGRARLDAYELQRRRRVQGEALGRQQRGEGESCMQLLRTRPAFVLPRLLALLVILACTLSLPWWLLR